MATEYDDYAIRMIIRLGISALIILVFVVAAAWVLLKRGYGFCRRQVERWLIAQGKEPAQYKPQLRLAGVSGLVGVLALLAVVGDYAIDRFRRPLFSRTAVRYYSEFSPDDYQALTGGSLPPGSQLLPDIQQQKLFGWESPSVHSARVLVPLQEQLRLRRYMAGQPYTEIQALQPVSKADSLRAYLSIRPFRTQRVDIPPYSVASVWLLIVFGYDDDDLKEPTFTFRSQLGNDTVYLTRYE